MERYGGHHTHSNLRYPSGADGAYPEPHHYTSIDEMLEKEELDILDICLPTYLHVPTAVKAMKKGIHVLSEKPISLKEEDIELAYSTAKENNVCFMIAQVLRFWPEYELIKELYDSGKYGKLLSGYMGRSAAILPGAGTTG